MASAMEEHFNALTMKVTQLLYTRTEGDRAILDKTIDEMNKLDYRYPIISKNTRAVLLVNQFSTLISPDDSPLVAKCCLLITNLINKQKVQIEGRTLSVTIEWILQALQTTSNLFKVDILIMLGALLKSNVINIHLLLPTIASKHSPVMQLAMNESVPELLLLAIQCLETCCSLPENSKRTNNQHCQQHLEESAKVFIKYLNIECYNFDILLHYKLLISCIRGLQNIILQHDDFLDRELGSLLGICKSYIVYQLKNVAFLAPQKLMPTNLSVPEPSPNKQINREKKGGKVTKQRKQRLSAINKKDRNETNDFREGYQRFAGGYVPATTTFDITGDSLTVPTKVRTSDSDFSDSDTGKNSRVPIVEGRVRQAASGLLLSISRNVDKKTMFSFWSSFIPESPLSGSHSLTNCILRDPLPKGRMAALNVLLSLLSSSKMYLSQAEYSDRVSSFTPFSVVLGTIIKELHHCLCLALNENSYPVLIQALKCLAALVQAAPYHRLAPGLTSKVIRNLKYLISHNDATVQVAALIVLGCVLASEPTFKETEIAFLRNVSRSASSIETNKSNAQSEDIDFAAFSSEDDDKENEVRVESDTPWLLRRCLENVNAPAVPSPVKLESLQVISAMSRNYFEALVLNHMTAVTKGLEVAVIDKYLDVRLHAGRTVEFLGQAMDQYWNDSVANKVTPGIIAHCSSMFWQTLLSRSIVSLLDDEHSANLRSVGCDCLGSIGTLAFEQLQKEKQLLCITMLFSCTRDDDSSVKGSAVRALAISVLHPSLRKDFGFVMDLTEAIHRTLEAESTALRVKSSWSLGNLSDALVLNGKDPNKVEELPEETLCRLMKDSIRCCNDNDKIKSNGVRALGNFLQLADDSKMATEGFQVICQQSIECLVKCSESGANMKVRWNACYALSKVLKNEALYTAGSNSWLRAVFDVLTALVIGFRNFKVRINAALALGSCPGRDSYGPHYHILWNTLIKALENSENMADYSEYKHRDHLVEQICLSLGYLMTLLTDDDIVPLDGTFSEKELKLQMHRVYDRLLPEKSSVLILAHQHLTTFKTPNTKQAKVLSSLRALLPDEVPSYLY